MSLDALLTELKKNSNLEATKILSEAETELSKIISDTKKSIAEKKTEMETTLQKELEQLKKQSIASAELEAKKVYLQTQKKILDELYNEILADLENLNEQQRKNFLIKLIKRSKSVIQNGGFYSSKKDADFIKLNSDYIYLGEIATVGGFIIENLDKTARLDLRFETLLESIWEKNLKDIAERLFK